MKEIAAFEAGIKLGALFHQFIGAPVSHDNAEILARAMESCMKLQPYVAEAEVSIDRKKLEAKLSGFGYCSLSPEMLRARVKVRISEVEVEAVLEWDEERNYPLMKLVR
ncbi:dihydroneopterin aldolase family protein [Geoglobus acetivorans]|uniref:Dihydroneopterin aldolase n=1 Tax=Geoglobus acetivorans TaxID=565033 RepID=A0ABZ3H492_GEOAI|nr:dihydroneopterin aldolase family protein [Geoglobus acetivorans]